MYTVYMALLPRVRIPDNYVQWQLAAIACAHKGNGNVVDTVDVDNSKAAIFMIE